MEKLYIKFKDLIDKQKFYEAHEVLEELWFPKRKSKDPDTLLLKAFINASVSFELKKRGKTMQAKKVWKNYEKYIEHINICSQKNFYHFISIKSLLEQKYKELFCA